MRPVLQIIGALLLAGVGWSADSAPGELLDQVRAKVLANAQRVPRYTCRQTVTRTEYRPQYGGVPDSCRALIAARDSLTSPGLILWHDRLRLDVAILDGRETFSWAGGSSFETNDIHELIAAGSTGSGTFASFLTQVFGLRETQIAFLGGDLFGFRVPEAVSGYQYRSHGTGAEKKSGFHGTLEIDAARADIRRMVLDADEFPRDEPTCRVRDEMNYHRVKMGAGDFLLPETARMTVLFRSGKESQNETRYSECREYVGESTIRFNDEAEAPGTDKPVKQAAKFPAGVKLELVLQPAVHSETAAAGDAITAVVRKGPHAGDIAHGRIVRFEQSLFPLPKWTLAMKFDAMEHNGVMQPVDLRPTKGDTFTFGERGNIVLNEKFRSEWESR
ncbi:MAG: hypothetical protein M3N93_12080 [Acidobacteriota bacterium]|nr:hypothetical protein [Acidobacteriota bacterium]